MRLFMLGQKTTGQAEALIIRLTRSSVRPWATLASRLAVGGAISIRAARSVSEMCWGSEESSKLKMSVWKGRGGGGWEVNSGQKFFGGFVFGEGRSAPRWVGLWEDV